MQDNERTGGLIAQVVGLADLVGYQDGSIVSRTIIDKPSGTVTLFAFAEGQGLSEHTAPLRRHGPCPRRQGGGDDCRPDTCAQGRRVVIMPANKTHALRAVGRFKCC